MLKCSSATLKQVVFNPARYRIFLGELETVEKRMSQPAFQGLRLHIHLCISAFAGRLEDEPDGKTRVAVRDHLYSLCAKTKSNRNVHLLQCWHGTSAPVAKTILEGGFAAIAKLDGGWFGKGIYFSSNAAYASKYCQQPPCIIMCCKY